MVDEAVADARGRLVRRQLIEAARIVFDQDGFYDSRIVDIVQEAGVGVGTFYRHFSSKSAVLIAAVNEVVGEIYASGSLSAETPDDPCTRIAVANERFFEIYARDRTILSLLEQLAPRDGEFKAIYLDLRKRSIRRLSHAISRWQELGHVDARVNAAETASLLTSMTNSQAHYWFNLGEPTASDASISDVTATWFRVLGLECAPTNESGT